jgi:hypothetical protein
MVAILMPDSGKNVVKRILMIVAVQRCGLIDRPCAMFKLVASTITCTGAVCLCAVFWAKPASSGTQRLAKKLASAEHTLPSTLGGSRKARLPEITILHTPTGTPSRYR